MTPVARMFLARCGFCIAVTIGLLVVQVGAATWQVPADYPTVQSAINATSSGDTVLVSSGTYFENLTLRSELVLIAASGPSFTVIDGSALATVITASSVSNTLVSGFTIQNGRGSGGDVGQHGGGFALHECGPTLVIRNNVIRNNIAWDGAGMHIWFGTGATIEDNFFQNNESQGQSPGAYGVGGGIMMDGPVSLRPVIRGNLFKGNHSDRGGSAIDCFNYAGPTVDRNAFLGNTCENTSPPYAAVVVFGGGNGVVTSCTIAQNIGGYGIWCAHGSQVSISNTIVALNDGAAAVGCDLISGASASCSDLFGNSGGDWSGCVASQVNINGNFSSDPLFCDILNGDHTLDGNSPCTPPQSGCGLIGAAGVGCNHVSVEPPFTLKSWGSIKSSYR